MTAADFKKAMKDAMAKYSIDAHTAAKIANANYPESFENIAKALTKITQEEMGIA